jgi:hypothetical protein
MELYGAKTREDARNTLKRRIVVFNDKKSGIMTVTFEDKDPVRSAEVVNFLVSELKRLNSDLAVTEAAQRRLFETQQKAAKETLIRSRKVSRVSGKDWVFGDEHKGHGRGLQPQPEAAKCGKGGQSYQMKKPEL